MKGNMVLNMVFAISLISIVISVNQSFAQESPDAFISNIILTPGNTLITTITLTPNVNTITAGNGVSESIELPTSTANKANQSPFEQVPPGSYDIGMVIPEGYTLMDAKCAFQKSNGKMIPIGSWDKKNMITGVVLTSQTAHKCTWKFEQQNTPSENTPIAYADVQKLLEMKGDPTGEKTIYKVVVTGKITRGPNADTGDKISSDKKTVKGVILTGMDDFYFTGDIVSITADHHIFSFVDGVEVPNGSPS